MEPVSALIPTSMRKSAEFSNSGNAVAVQRASVKNKVDTLNAMDGDLPGWNCKTCKNRGYIAVIDEGGESFHTVACRDCTTKRACILKMEKSGLRDVIKNYTFDKFKAGEKWQADIKAAAEEYAAAPDGKWFALCGQSGSGKTHLCTAICRKFLLDNRQVVYMPWRDDVAIIKSYENKDREAKLQAVKNAEVLYIDDFLKTGAARDGTTKPTGFEVAIAYEIINYRYTNRLVTVLSSEFAISEITIIDEAIGGRIAEMCDKNAISISRDKRKNYRMRGAV